ncbi:replicative DNA helicase [Fibrobacterota bacterium]
MMPTPQAVEKEKTILGSLLFDISRCTAVIEKLKPDHFYYQSHQLLYQAILELFQNEKEINIESVEFYLRKKGELNKVGGPDSLLKLTEEIYTISGIDALCETVKENFLRRKYIVIAQEIIETANNEQSDIQEIIATAEKGIFNLSDQNFAQGLESMAVVVNRVKTEIEAIEAGKKPGVLTGFKTIDKVTFGLRPKTMTVIASRPGMGKTALALNIAENSNVNVAFFSIEMGSEEICERLITSFSGITSKELRNGTGIRNNNSKFLDSVSKASKSKIWIDGSPRKTPSQVISQCRRLKQKTGLDLIIVDYLQFMEMENKVESKRQEVTDISRMLKRAAKELDVPVIALAQLNRVCETRPDKRPFLSDLKESGAIEQDANMVWFIYRDEVYRKNAEEGKTEIIIRKNRSGPTPPVRIVVA